MELLKRLAAALDQGQTDVVTELTRQAVTEGVPAVAILNEGLIAGMETVGEKFRTHEIFLPDVLLAARANVNIADSRGQTALLAASFNLDKEMIEMLVDNGADVTYALDDGHTDLIRCARFGKHEVLRWMLDAGADTAAVIRYLRDRAPDLVTRFAELARRAWWSVSARS